MTFAGVISDFGGGSVAKTGTGKLTLSGRNTYTGGTAINAGTLYVASQQGSATGSGDVFINAGKLGGIGKLAGNVIVGDGRLPEAYLTPGIAVSRPARLAVRKTLTFASDGTFHFGYRSDGTGDRAIARGITINPGAELFFGPIDNDTINVGTVFTVLENSANTPIAGVFANIADGGTITVGNNTFQANYEGGHGSDLTLTVVQ